MSNVIWDSEQNPLVEYDMTRTGKKDLLEKIKELISEETAGFSGRLLVILTKLEPMSEKQKTYTTEALQDFRAAMYARIEKLLAQNGLT